MALTGLATRLAVVSSRSLGALAAGQHCVYSSKRYSSSDSMVGKHFLTLRDFSQAQIEQLLWTSMDLKNRIKNQKELFQPLVGKNIGLIFQKRSTRTRLSSELGMAKLGGKAAFLSPDDIHLGVNESVSDSAKVLSGFCDMILARVYGQADLDTLASEGSIPIISGLSDLYHPLQTLADLVTLQERFGRLQGLKMAWVGDGNNIIHSLMMGGMKLGVEIRVATPKGYECDAQVTTDAINFSKEFGTNLSFTNDPMEAVDGADVIVTDTWVSMGQEEEKVKRLRDFKGYQVNREMVNAAAKDWVFLHCLPRKPEEVTDDVFYDKQSLVWQEAENRMWTVMAVMLHQMQDYTCQSPKPSFRS